MSHEWSRKSVGVNEPWLSAINSIPGTWSDKERSDVEHWGGPCGASHEPLSKACQQRWWFRLIKSQQSLSEVTETVGEEQSAEEELTLSVELSVEAPGERRQWVWSSCLSSILLFSLPFSFFCHTLISPTLSLPVLSFCSFLKESIRPHLYLSGKKTWKEKSRSWNSAQKSIYKVSFFLLYH